MWIGSYLLHQWIESDFCNYNCFSIGLAHKNWEHSRGENILIIYSL